MSFFFLAIILEGTYCPFISYKQPPRDLGNEVVKRDPREAGMGGQEGLLRGE
jgi:hypothetical protein